MTYALSDLHTPPAGCEPLAATSACAPRQAGTRPLALIALTALTLLTAVVALTAAPVAQAAPGPGAAEGRLAATEVLTRRGDTLERLARRHHPRAAFTPAALVQAWRSVNAAAFPGGLPHRLPAGLRLRVPTELDLARLYVPNALVPQAQAGDGSGPGEAHAEAPPATAGTGATRPRWIRYP